jgi:hypothetical protein
MEYLKVFEEFKEREYWSINISEFKKEQLIKISQNEINKIKDISKTKGFECQEKSEGDYNLIYLEKIRKQSNIGIKIYKDYDDYFHASIYVKFRTSTWSSHYKADQIEGIIKLIKNKNRPTDLRKGYHE